MTLNIQDAIDLHKSGMSMADIGLKLSRSAAWVCKGFKSIGYVPVKARYNKYALTDQEAAFVLANTDKPYQWIGDHINKSAQSISQWLQKRGIRKIPSSDERRIPERPCPCCNSEFKPRQSAQIYCSTKCMGLAKKTLSEIACAQCTSPYMPTLSKQKFCSVECAQEGYQQQHIKVRPYSHNGVKMRSTWEVKFAAWLDLHNLKWKYEPTFFALPNQKRYAPDFYVPTHDAYYEIKGWMKREAAEKIRQFREIYSHESLIVVNKDVFKLYGIKL